MDTGSSVQYDAAADRGGPAAVRDGGMAVGAEALFAFTSAGGGIGLPHWLERLFSGSSEDGNAPPPKALRTNWLCRKTGLQQRVVRQLCRIVILQQVRHGDGPVAIIFQ